MIDLRLRSEISCSKWLQNFFPQFFHFFLSPRMKIRPKFRTKYWPKNIKSRNDNFYQTKTDFRGFCCFQNFQKTSSQSSSSSFLNFPIIFLSPKMEINIFWWFFFQNFQRRAQGLRANVVVQSRGRIDVVVSESSEVRADSSVAWSGDDVWTGSDRFPLVSDRNRDLHKANKTRGRRSEFDPESGAHGWRADERMMVFCPKTWKSISLVPPKTKVEPTKTKKVIFIFLKEKKNAPFVLSHWEAFFFLFFYVWLSLEELSTHRILTTCCPMNFVNIS